MDIRRFGPGHRRADGPAGTQGVEGAVIHHDERSRVSELVFGRYAMVVPHSNPNTTLFIVISGGGYVQVGSERTRVNHGEAVLWPAGIPHGAYTEGSEMRAIVIELPSGDSKVLEGRAAEVLPTRAGAAGVPETADEKPTADARRADGQLADRPRSRADYDASEGEPW